MKKYLSIIFAFTVIGCSNESDLVQPKQEVDVTLDYSFMESGNMSRAASDVYSNFYEKYIKSKRLTPTSYYLLFKNKETGVIAAVNGLWKNKDVIRLLEGEYEVTGSSYPNRKVQNAPLDTLYLTFKEDIVISKNMNTITLTAIHDSYMLIFDAYNSNKIDYKYDTRANNSNATVNVTHPLTNLDDIYYMFINSLWGYENTQQIIINKKDGYTTDIKLYQMPFEKGKYYYFNDIDNSFNIPPMEEGK